VSAKSRRRVTLNPEPSNDALSHGLAMVAVPVVFGLLGSLLDGRIGTAPVFLLVFAAFGVAGAFASAFYRYEARINRQEAGKPWTRRNSRAETESVTR
jgi:F0F1-type ATP synthase assembly protein I